MKSNIEEEEDKQQAISFIINYYFILHFLHYHFIYFTFYIIFHYIINLYVILNIRVEIFRDFTSYNTSFDWIANQNWLSHYSHETIREFYSCRKQEFLCLE